VAAETPEVWRINNRVNLLLVGKINDLGNHRTLPRAGRTVARQLALLHSSRAKTLG